MPRDGLAGIGLAGAGGGEGEGIGRREPVILYDVLAGPEVPPEIGVVNLGREPAQPQDYRQDGGDSGEPAENRRLRLG